MVVPSTSPFGGLFWEKDMSDQPVDYERIEPQDCDGCLAGIILVGIIGMLTGIAIGAWLVW